MSALISIHWRCGARPARRGGPHVLEDLAPRRGGAARAEPLQDGPQLARGDACSAASGYTAPVGLLGVHRMSMRLAGVSTASSASCKRDAA